MAFSSFGLPAPGLAAPGLAPQLNLNGGQQGLGLAAGRGGGGERLWLGQIPGAKPRPKSRLSALNQGFSTWWSRIYHGEAKPETIHDRLQTFQDGGRQANPEALKNMDAAVAVFLGDKIIAPKEFLDFLGVKEGARWTEDLLKKVLIRTGSVETGFDIGQKKQITKGGGIGPGRSYWQVEPKTALDLLNNSEKLFGQNFENHFRDKVISNEEGSPYQGSTYGEQASKAGYTGDNAVRDWLASFQKLDKEGKNMIQQLNLPERAREAGYKGGNTVGEWEISKILLADGDLAATLAAGKWNAALQNLVK
jgi:hypothetical protein